MPHHQLHLWQRDPGGLRLHVFLPVRCRDLEPQAGRQGSQAGLRLTRVRLALRSVLTSVILVQRISRMFHQARRHRACALVAA